MKVSERKLVSQPVSQGAVLLGKDSVDVNHPGKQGQVNWRDTVALYCFVKDWFKSYGQFVLSVFLFLYQHYKRFK